MPELEPGHVARVEKGIAGSPYSALLGIEMVCCEPDRLVLRLPFREALVTLGDMVHGGAIASLVDVAATGAFWAHPDVTPGSRGTTIGFTVNFLAAARGVDLEAEARVRRRGRSVCTGEVTVRDPDGGEVAVALVTYKLSA